MMSKKIVCSKCNKQLTKIDIIKKGSSFICGDCDVDTLDSINGELLESKQNVGKVDLISCGEIVTDVLCDDSDSNLSQAASALGVKNKQEDLLYIRFKLVHANTNKNRDTFTKEEMKAAEKTPILKLLNWQHGEPNIGVIFSSKYVESKDSNEEDYLECIAAVSKYKYKRYAEEIVDRHNSNNLFFSMETWFKEAQCSSCNEVFTKGEDSYCHHLRGRYAEDSGVSRVLRGLTFAGAGVVESPADIDADSLAIASDRNKNLANKEAIVVNYTQEQVDQMIADAVAQAIAGMKSIDEYQELATKVEAMDQRVRELEVDIDKMTSEKREIESKYEEVSASFDNYKKEIETEKLVASRLSQLKEAGYVIPDKATEAEKYDTFIVKLQTLDDNAFDFLREMISATKINTSENEVDAEEEIESSEANDKGSDDNDIPMSRLTDQNNNSMDFVSAALNKVLRTL